MARSVQSESSAARRARRKRAMLWSYAVILAAVLVLPMSGYLYAYLSPQTAQAAAKQDTNPRANFWRAVRGGDPGYTSESGPYTTNVLIQNGGENWRQVRNGPVAAYGAGLMGIVLALIIAFYLYRGRVRIASGRSGVRVPRWTMNDRMLHWITATTFIILAITGLSLLYGRAVLIPVFGLEGFSLVAAAFKFVHNLFGPIFVVALVFMIFSFMPGNLPEKGDLKWILEGGGLLGKHASSGRYNAGEKIWFWVVFTMGIIASVTGLILDFPLFGQTRGVMQWSQTIHAVSTIIFVSGALGHIYIGTLGMEGALEAMTQGSVDANWAKEHHDLWYEDMKRRGRVGAVEGAPGSKGTRSGAPAGHRA
jgi:formate dehydrogenase subunit gamma